MADEKKVVETTEQTTETAEAKETEPKEEKTESVNAEVERLKRQLSRANSEAADYRRKWQEKATEAEQAEAARAEAERAKDEELATLRREKTVAGYANQFMGIGYDGETSAKLAQSLPDGVTADFFAEQKRFFDAKVAAAQADALKTQPTLSAGSVPQGDTSDFLAALKKAAKLT